MPLVYAQSDSENYPQITSLMRKTKRDGATVASGAAKRPALATISNFNNNNDLSKKLQQQQKNPFSVRVDTKKPSPKQRQLRSRTHKGCGVAPKSVTQVVRQSTLPSYKCTKENQIRVPAPSNDDSLDSSINNILSNIMNSANTSSSTASVLVNDCPMSVERTFAGFDLKSDSCLEPADMSMDCEVNDVKLVKDIDASANAQFDSPEYVDDIDEHLRKAETLYKPRSNYMSKQKSINFVHRSTVVDWLYEVYEEFNLQRKTYNLAVSYVDRFLSKLSIGRPNLQLLGTTCLFIACKFEEIDCPEARNFVYITDDTYQLSQVLKMESLILQRFGYEMNSPTTCCFEDRFCKASDADFREKYLGEYLCDSALVHGERFLKYKPSMLCAASLCLARATLRPTAPHWTATLEHYTKYSVEDISECVTDLLWLMKLNNVETTRRFSAVHNKYSSPKYVMIAMTTPLESLSLH